MPSNKLVSDYVKSAILHYAQNTVCTQKRIAELTGVSERSVYRVLKQHGELKHMPRMTPESVKAEKVLKQFNLTFAHVPGLLHTLKDMKVNVLTVDNRPAQVAVQIEARVPTRGQIVKAIVDMDDVSWGAILKEIVTARVAKNSNNMVATAMLNICNAVDKNAKPGNN